MTDASRVVVLGSGFAGLWAALAAARRLDELGVGTVDITMISCTPYHDIRVRDYETDLSTSRIPLSDLLDPVGVEHILGEVTAIDAVARLVESTAGAHGYDRLVLALGSQVVKPDIPGLREFGFDIDTYDAAIELQAHLRLLAEGPDDPAAATVVVVGAGLTGIEEATGLPAMLAGAFAARAVAPRVVLIDRNPFVGSDMGVSARPVIEAALAATGIETRLGVGVVAIDERGVRLSSGEVVPAATVVWCAGMRANPLTADFGVDRDRLGRLPVDDCLRVCGVPGVFAAGDVAAAKMDDEHMSVMSCQHSRPMGRWAGYNVIGDLLGEPMKPLRIPWYVTVLDLGPAGAVYTEGWERRVVACGEQAKDTKRAINTRRIYPPLSRDRAALLAAAAPELQTAPEHGH
ncbi:NAD(P)/FAD-dependent oxidoreductase [Nocardia niwae]|uniref:NAD(P)/FAD-dependent oxidoreductase n=1 Tax=Nocardia niwae TaxID=626084 RepID=UPI0007A4DCE3|nr:FAD-dependent oxidoreductase [Nocardia niwae]